MTVLVVGAGPTGLATAVGLARAGATVRLVDAASGPATSSRALGLQPRGVEVLDRLDALGDLPERSVPMRGTVIRVDGRERLRLALPAQAAPDGRAALVISQAEIEAQLRQRLTDLGGGIEWGTGVTGLSQDEAGVEVALERGKRFRCDWVAGCDGASSAVRKTIGVSLLGETAAERFLLADVLTALPVPRDFASMWAADDGTLAAIPLPGAPRVAPHGAQPAGAAGSPERGRDPRRPRRPAPPARRRHGPDRGRALDLRVSHPPPHCRPLPTRSCSSGGAPATASPTCASTRANGPARLHTVLRGCWALVSAPGAARSDTATALRGQLGENRLTELSAPDLPPHSVLLVRPDGHVGWHGRTSEPEATHEWLAAVLAGRAVRVDTT